jgi:hypothetical protein
MSIYIVPSNGDFSEIQEIASRAGVELFTPQTIREFILQTHDIPFAIVAMGPDDMLALSRHAATLVPEMPSVVASVPGLIYEGSWVSQATAFPSIDWSEMAKKMEKSGHLATTPEDLEKRDVGSPTFDIRHNSLLKQRTSGSRLPIHDDEAKKDDDYGNVDDEADDFESL